MESILSYNSSDSEPEDDFSTCSKQHQVQDGLKSDHSESDVSNLKTSVRLNSITDSNSKMNLKRKQTSKSIDSNKSRTTAQGFQGYGAYLHLNQAEASQSPNTSIYGVTKRPKQTSNYRHHHHHSYRNRATSSSPAAGGGMGQQYPESRGNRQYPPPGYHEPRQDVVCTQTHYNSSGSLSQHQNDQRYHPSERHLAHEMHNVLPDQGHHTEPNPSSKTSNKQDHHSSDLKPYVPKRKRKPNPNLQGANCSDAESGNSADMFAIDPYISSKRNKSRTSCRPPKQLFCSFSSHQGPVTHVQWNVPEFSHLLLSSSMDKTVKVWDYSIQKRCVQTLSCHEGAVKDAQWSVDGRQILSCGFDKTARLTDVQSGTNFQVFEHSSYVTCIRWHPGDPQTFLAGTYGSTIYRWDTRTGGIVHQYSGKLGQILALEFINDGAEFVASCDTVSRDSADKTIMVWDANTPALLSNQLYHEKYTCTCFKSHPTEDVFLAQSNASYIALFSSKRPYRLNKYQRFEGHQVEGYQVDCDVSPDGSLVASGSSDGKTYIYSYRTSTLIKTLGGTPEEEEGGACVGVAWHPVLPGVLASCSWDGAVNVWS